jgi:5-oxoprolinase (ATP-hydrolysing)
VVGAARTGEAAGFPRIIGFDMGGTSTDVCLYAGALERAFETEVAGVALRTPMMAINTVAAGGGSILHFDKGRLRVGPDSAGADPGPACYQRGGPLTLTDANLLVGKIQPRHFPAIFGANGDQPLDYMAVARKFTALTEAIATETQQRQDPRDIAEGFLRVAVANMAQAIRQVSLEKGHDASDFALQCFGGAGGQHACLVADELGINTVLIHPLAGVLSAYGIGLADQSVIRRQAIERPLDDDAAAEAEGVLSRLANDAMSELAHSVASGASLTLSFTVDLRYAGTDASLGVPFAEIAAMREAFDAAHQRRFGFATPGHGLIIESVQVEATVNGELVKLPTLPTREGAPAAPVESATLWSGGQAQEALIFDRSALCAGDTITGPALICETIATTVVEPGWAARVGPSGDLVLTRTAGRVRCHRAATDRADPVQLELFSNLFMAVAERMGVVLRNTSASVNIKERLDFSCALFDATGALIANAPHVPVHLGAMGDSVRAVLASRRATLRPGDMIALNNPFNGGTHLPDVTVIAPVFDETGTTIRFFVGNRGHHADIGGVTPGSTPPDSMRLDQEGVVINDFLLRDGAVFREDAFRELLSDAPFPARSPDVNISDIKAQIAANEAGIRELGAIVVRYGWETVAAYMRHVMDNAEESVRRVIDRLSDGAFDYEMDDGSHIRVKVAVNHAKREALIDFTGTDSQRPGNFNAPPSVTRAAVLYVFRCLTGDDLPLNEGCMRPLLIHLPEGTFLSPTPGAAVVAGNTEVSQAICNALLGAVGASAASQGTMNNLLLGDADYQYYETICGGAGAGPGFGGASAVHTHMTNTRITDPEVMELRYPMRLESFAIRRGSGGAGRHPGGDGAIRKIRVLRPATASIVASRRRVAPFGLAGGSDGAAGRQHVVRANGDCEELPGVAKVELAADDVIVIETPGGGGWGKTGREAT